MATFVFSNSVASRKDGDFRFKNLIDVVAKVVFANFMRKSKSRSRLKKKLCIEHLASTVTNLVFATICISNRKRPL